MVSQSRDRDAIWRAFGRERHRAVASKESVWGGTTPLQYSLRNPKEFCLRRRHYEDTRHFSNIHVPVHPTQVLLYVANPRNN